MDPSCAKRLCINYIHVLFTLEETCLNKLLAADTDLKYLQASHRNRDKDKVKLDG